MELAVYQALPRGVVAQLETTLTVTLIWTHRVTVSVAICLKSALILFGCKYYRQVSGL